MMEKTSPTVCQNAIIQVSPVHFPELAGCLLIVAEVDEAGVVAYEPIPGGSNLLFRVNHGSYVPVGFAQFIDDSYMKQHDDPRLRKMENEFIDYLRQTRARRQNHSG